MAVEHRHPNQWATFSGKHENVSLFPAPYDNRFILTQSPAATITENSRSTAVVRQIESVHKRIRQSQITIKTGIYNGLYLLLLPAGFTHRKTNDRLAVAGNGTQYHALGHKNPPPIRYAAE